jgi:type IV pilus assembly protein PilW
MRSPGNPGHRHEGFSLVELMATLVIDLCVIGAAIAVYLKAEDTYATAESLGRLQENARHAMGLIEADVRMANFWGLHNQPDLIATNAASAFPLNCGATWVTSVASFITGGNNAYTLPCASSGGGAQPDADVLIVRRASAQRIAPQSAHVAAVNRDRVLVVSNPLSGEIFVPKDIGDGIPAGYATSDPANAPPLADTRELLVNAYYVSRNSSVATGYPALRRKRLTAGPSISDEELLPGVEDLQFELGVDTNGDANVDAFVKPGAVPAGGTPISVRLWLRVRAQDRDNRLAVTPATAYADRSWPATHDGYRRLLVHKTLQLRNAPR